MEIDANKKRLHIFTHQSLSNKIVSRREKNLPVGNCVTVYCCYIIPIFASNGFILKLNEIALLHLHINMLKIFQYQFKLIQSPDLTLIH